ncbi:MAG: riboflavin biosynthesis protein RibF [Clostridiales bacterium]|jgi:riboflavin kinase/FMN adenylyltransferase|nr:riboflavin biosynthesis protein RibF [Clostridiales bacterium]
MLVVKFGQRINESLVITLGYMDCVHLGHRRLIEKAAAAAEFLNDFDGAAVKTAAFTFFNNPFPVLGRDVLPVYDFGTRLKYFRTDYVIAAEFDAEFAGLDAPAFLSALLGTADIKAVVVGADYRFSADAAADAAFLSGYLAERKVDLIVAETVKVNGVKVSSSDIRRRIADGDVRGAGRLLGSPYTISGTVVHGAHIGASLGFPTANVLPNEGVTRLKEGVYATKTRVGSGYFSSITNAGSRPTFSYGTDYVYETHIDGINYDIYGKNIEVEFIDRIRDTVKFESKEELIAQLKNDKKIFGIPY